MPVGFLVRNTAALTTRWTTVQWLAAASEKGPVAVFQTDDVTWEDGELATRAFWFDRPHDGDAIVHALTRRTARRVRLRVDRLDHVLWRCAPLSLDRLGVAHQIEAVGVPVYNAPSGMLVVSDKAWLASQTDLPLPKTVVTTRRGDAHRLLDDWGELVIKPSRGSGGQAVQRVADPESLDEAFDQAFRSSRRVLLQEVLDPSGGERRLLWCDGSLLGGYVRHAAPGEFRHNVSQGASVAPLEQSPADHDLCERLSKRLLELGISFAALDVLDDRLIEINATNPGGTLLADGLHGTRLAHAVLDRLNAI